MSVRTINNTWQVNRFCGLFSILIWAWLVSPSSVHCREDQWVDFNKKDYPDSVNVVTTKVYHHGDCTIKIIQDRNLDNKRPHEGEYYCRAWVEIRKNGKIVRRLFYRNLEPVGSWYGLYVPRKKPSTQYFAILKYDAYDGTIFLVDKSGQLREYWGHNYVLSKDGDYLLTDYGSDLGGVEVVELETGKSLAKFRPDKAYIHDWYSRNGAYFVQQDDSLHFAFKFDFASSKFLRVPTDSLFWREAVHLDSGFDWGNKMCGCVLDPMPIEKKRTPKTN